MRDRVASLPELKEHGSGVKQFFKQQSPIDCAELLREKVGKANYYAFLREQFVTNETDSKRLTASHHELTRLPVNTIFTTNFDELIELAFRGTGRGLRVSSTLAEFNAHRQERDLIHLVKLNGSIDRPDTTILCRMDFAKARRERTGAYCPIRSMVREPYDCIIGDAQIRAIPLGRVATVRGSLWRHAYTAIVEAMMNRRKSNAEPEGLSQLNLNAAGIDVGATSHFVAVPADRVEESVREFAAFTADLYRLADWLVECRVDTVVMESTGVYWIPLFGVLQERGFQVMLVDPRRIKNVPGRKTDVLDCQWLQQLHTYGLLSGAFRPDGDIRRLRSYLRQRAMLVEYASQHIQHTQKALTQMNVKLQHVISDIAGKTGTEIIEAIVGGQRDPVKLAQLRDPQDQGRRGDHRKVVAGPLAGGAHLRADPGSGTVPGVPRQDCRVRPGD